MTRLWTFSKSNGNGNGGGSAHGPTQAPWPPPAELVAAPSTGVVERYDSRPVRPIASVAIRVVLWGAVALGAIGGLVGLLRPSGGGDEPVAVPQDDRVDVPAPVAGTAEMVVQEWLTATEDDEERLAQLFVEPPSLAQVDTTDVQVGRVTTIAGRPLQENYWAVTVRAEVSEPIEVTDDAAADDPAAAENGGVPAAPAQEERQTSVWYLEVGIAGDVETGLVALTTPAVLPGPPAVATGWRPSLTEPDAPADGDPTAATVEGFFDALLAGNGDPERYVSPGVTATAANPPPFADTEVESLAIDQLPEDGGYRVLANIWGTTPGGARQRFAYELVVVERVDRLEITQFSGAPTMVAGSAEVPDQSGESDQSDQTDQTDQTDPGSESPAGTSSETTVTG